MTVWFVTGTDTGVGKTVVTAALAAWVRANGSSAYVVKPAQTGVGPDEPGDLAEVRRLVEGVPGHEGVRLREPLAPDTAARLEGVPLPSLQDQVAGIANAVEWYSDVIVEGAGGVLVRLGDVWNLLDLAQAVAHAGHEVRVLVVARAGLGTLNHTALTVDAITRRELHVPGVVIGAWPDEPDLAARQNLEDLPALTGVPIVGRIPDGAGRLDSTAFTTAVRGWLAALEG